MRASVFFSGIEKCVLELEPCFLVGAFALMGFGEDEKTLVVGCPYPWCEEFPDWLWLDDYTFYRRIGYMVGIYLS